MTHQSKDREPVVEIGKGFAWAISDGFNAKATDNGSVLVFLTRQEAMNFKKRHEITGKILKVKLHIYDTSK